MITASRYGIDSDLPIYSKVKIGWLPEHAVQVETDGGEKTNGANITERIPAEAELSAAAATGNGGT